MFKKLEKTNYPPADKPEMIWDGSCGFCEYWTSRWKKISGEKIIYRPYQEASGDYPDIEINRFREASRLIETDGKVFSGPRSAYRTLTYGSKWSFLDRWYEKSTFFRKISDKTYDFVAKNRNFFFKITKFLWGSDPKEVRPFWLIYIIVILYVIFYGW